MPVSRHRKDHKKKVNKYKADNKLARTRLKEKMMREYMEKIQSSQELKRQENSELVTSEDINVDLDVDLSGPLDAPVIEDAVIIDDTTDQQSKSEDK